MYLEHAVVYLLNERYQLGSARSSVSARKSTNNENAFAAPVFQSVMLIKTFGLSLDLLDRPNTFQHIAA